MKIAKGRTGISYLLKELIYCILLFIPLLALNACLPQANDSLTAVPLVNQTVTESPIIPISEKTRTPYPSNIPFAPTLSQTEAYNLLANQFRNSGACQLPCFWGITPGLTSPRDLRSKFLPIAGIADLGLIDSTDGEIYFIYPRNDILIDIGLSYRPNDAGKVIQVVMLSTQVRHKLENLGAVFGSPEYDEFMGPYSLQNILSKYGPPNQVMVRVDILAIAYTPSPHNDLSPETLEITLFYPERGIFVRYTMLAERVGEKIRGCPAKSFVELWLLSPDLKSTYNAILSSKDKTWEGNWPYSKPIEEASRMTVENFSQSFKDKSSICLETPLRIWPEH